MVIGIIQIIIGAIVLVNGFLAGNIKTSVQQTVQALWELIGVILICSGIISIFY